jgi:hypothetical protein
VHWRYGRNADGNGDRDQYCDRDRDEYCDSD